MAQLRTLLRALLGLTFFPSSLWAEPPTELLPQGLQNPPHPQESSSS